MRVTQRKTNSDFFCLCLNDYNQAFVGACIFECVYVIDSSDILYCTSKSGTDIFMGLSDPSAQVQLGIKVLLQGKT